MYILKLFKVGVSIFAATALSACLSISQDTPVTPLGQECGFDRYRLNADQNAYPESEIDRASASAFENESSLRPLLFLSGGGLNGAFGAGVLDGWAAKRGGTLPDFAVVTGVSTGALLSLAAFANTPNAARKGYEIEHESEAIDLLINYNGRKLTAANYLEAVEAGGIADLEPLKRSVYKILHDPEFQMLEKIIAKSYAGRKLYTGVVDLDTGEAVALDMSEMAKKIGRFQFGTPERTKYTKCFIDAVAASSSVPMAARPVAIDNRLYIDGGARFLVFTDKIGPMIEPPRPAMVMERDGPHPTTLPPPPKRQIYMVINGTQKIKPNCEKYDPQSCAPTADMWSEVGARQEWNLIEVALRSIDILQNQVKEFSAEAVRMRAVQSGQADLNPIKINATDRARHTFSYEGNLKTCEEWKDFDQEIDGSLQFHKRYMRCMIDLGQRRVLADHNWQ
jgi:hypothetical protein